LAIRIGSSSVGAAYSVLNFPMMSLLTELDLFCDRNLQRCQPYGLEKSVFIGVHPWLNSFAPIVHPKMKTGKEPFKCGMASADCGVVEQQSNEATKLYRLGCLVPWLFKRVPVRRHQISVIAQPRAPRCPCAMRLWSARTRPRFGSTRHVASGESDVMPSHSKKSGLRFRRPRGFNL
jgi:hypothetical protein